MIVNKVYSRIDWKNYPNTSTALNETNLNRMDKAIDDLDNRVIEQDSTKADQTTVNNMVKNWTMDETTGVITVEKQDGSKIMFDLNIEKIPVSFEMSPSGILTMTTSDGTQFTANIGSMIPVLTFNESEQIAVSVSGSGVNKTYSFTVKDGSITGSKLQPNYLADVKSESEKAKMSETNAEKFKNESEKIYEAMKRLEHKIEVNENEPSDLNVNDEWLYFYGTGSDFNKAKNYVKTTEKYKLLSRWTSSDTVDVNGKTLTGVVDELKKTSQDNGYGEVAGGKNLVNPNKFLKWVNQYTTGQYLNDVITISPVNNYLYQNFFKFSDIDIDVTLSIKSLSYSGGTNVRVCLVNSAGTIVEKVTTSTLSASGLACGIKIDYSTLPTSLIITKMMVEEGSVATEYEPYFPSNKMLAEENTKQSTEMMDIKMLGWSVPRECTIQNSVSGNVFTQKIGRVDLGSLDWTKYDVTQGTLFRASLLSNMKSYGNNDVANAYVNGYTTSASNTRAEKTLSMTANGIDLINSSYTDADTFKQAMQGQYLYYELATYNTITIDGNEIGETVSGVRKETTVNLLNPTLQTTTQNGVTCTNNGDGTYTLSGTNSSSSSNITFILDLNYSNFPTSKVKLVGCPTLSESDKVKLQTRYNGTWGTPSLWDTGKGVILKNGQLLTKIAILVYPSKNVDGVVIKPMLSTNLSATYDDFVPYTGDSGSLNGDVAKLKNDLDKLSSLPKGSIIQIEKAKDDPETTTQKYGWQYLGTSNIQYENGSERLLATNVYRKNN